MDGRVQKEEENGEEAEDGMVTWLLLFLQSRVWWSSVVDRVKSGFSMDEFRRLQESEEDEDEEEKEEEEEEDEGDDEVGVARSAEVT